jgi:hypothetical protein
MPAASHASNAVIAVLATGSSGAGGIAATIWCMRVEQRWPTVTAALAGDGASRSLRVRRRTFAPFFSVAP